MPAAARAPDARALLDREPRAGKDEFVRRCVAKLADVLAGVAPKIRRAALREIETLAATHAGDERGCGVEANLARLGRGVEARPRRLGAPSRRGRGERLGGVPGADPTPRRERDAAARRRRRGFLADVAAFLRVASESDVPGEARDEHADTRGTTGFRTGLGVHPRGGPTAPPEKARSREQEYRGGVLALLEALSRCAPSLLAVPEAVAGDLLPALAETLAKTDGSADSRFLALKLACDAATPLLLEKRAAANGRSLRLARRPSG